MWIYRRDWLKHRLRTSSATAYWLDYWLFLHSPETHPVWNSRPLGLHRLATAALEAVEKHDRVLRNQLAREVVAASRIAPFVACAGSPPTGDPLVKDAWQTSWIRWLERLRSEASSQNVMRDIIPAIGATLAAGDFWTASFLCRRLAAELAEEEWSRSVLFTAARERVLNHPALLRKKFNTAVFCDVVGSMFAHPFEQNFIVTVPVSQAPISKRALSSIRSLSDVDVICLNDPERGVIVDALRFRVTALHQHEASAIALEQTRHILEHLRTLHYVRTHLVDRLIVRTELEGSDVFLPLPQPFWTRRLGDVRDTPTLPANFDETLTFLKEPERRRWRAARWHASQALADWAEDNYSAASHTWQALEAFTGSSDGGWKQVLPIVAEYLKTATTDLVVYLATGVTSQMNEIKALGIRCNWHGWIQTDQPLSTWLRRVMSPGSPNVVTKWQPAPSALTFDNRVGLLRLLANHMAISEPVGWMRDRLEGDLSLLYGVRNSVVHRGQRSLGRPLVNYLGRSALELLFAVMRHRSDSIHETTIHGPT